VVSETDSAACSVVTIGVTERDRSDSAPESGDNDRELNLAAVKWHPQCRCFPCWRQYTAFMIMIREVRFIC
jgi:hypothetical protein